MASWHEARKNCNLILQCKLWLPWHSAKQSALLHGKPEGGTDTSNFSVKLLPQYLSNRPCGTGKMPLAHRPGDQDFNKNPRSGHRLKSYRLTIQACMTFVMTRVWTVNQKCRCNTLTTVDTGKGELTNKNPSIKPSIKAMMGTTN